jgi:hypothetical protein
VYDITDPDALANKPIYKDGPLIPESLTPRRTSA